MNRRTFLKRFGLTIPAVAFAPKVALDIYEKIKIDQLKMPNGTTIDWGENGKTFVGTMCLDKKTGNLYILDMVEARIKQSQKQMEKELARHIWRRT